jgi:hypothetical protein
MTSEPAWQRYQEEVADFFRSIGLRAETDVPVTGVRGKHDVDVLVRGERAGIHQAWIVECKRLNRAVSKDKVLTLAQIVQDVGADRGILVCEKGYQAGAVRMAAASNVSLASLADLRENAQHERAQIDARGTLSRLILLQDQLSEQAIVKRSAGTTRIAYPRGVDVSEILALHARLGIAQSGLLRALAGAFPIAVDIDTATDAPRSAATLAEAALLASAVADYAEGLLARWRASSTRT